jgi:hypothetical protein
MTNHWGVPAGAENPGQSGGCPLLAGRCNHDLTSAPPCSPVCPRQMQTPLANNDNQFMALLFRDAAISAHLRCHPDFGLVSLFPFQENAHSRKPPSAPSSRSHLTPLAASLFSVMCVNLITFFF